MKNKSIYLIMFIICMLLTIGICVQIKTVDNISTGIAKTQQENELRDSVLKLKEKYNALYNKEIKKEEELENLRTEVSNLNNDSIDYSKQISKMNVLLGLTDIYGEGIVITVKDANVTGLIGMAKDFVVHDGDLLEIVNALKNAGAEAISINGQRIVNLTAITCAGNIIRINGEKQGSPFEIKAIGLTEKLYGALKMPGGYLELLEEDGVQVKVEKQSNIHINKYDGVYKFNYAQNIE